MKRILAALLLTALLLCGCSSGSGYVHVTPHSGHTEGNSTGSVPAENYQQLRAALAAMVRSASESGVIHTVKMNLADVEQNMQIASRSVQNEDPLGAYAVDEIRYEVGTTGGKTAVAVSIDYHRSLIDIKKVLQLDDMSQVNQILTEALEDCRSSITMLIQNYEESDIAQQAVDLARANPRMVMEIPEVSEAVYGSGADKVVELSFSYSNSRDSLRSMQLQVRPIFDASSLYVSAGSSDHQKLSQLYAFLMERFDYTLETSVTPSYSLLVHGVGDSRAFASVYASMCIRSGMECLVVTGTRSAEPWSWNIVRDGERYYHVDLLASSAKGVFQEWDDEDMAGYVWDYSAYPACSEENIFEKTEK